jgi:trans-2,3-dihydro-3-hydroxyanthranilate isomerase
MPVDLFASCVGLLQSEIVVSSHRPMLASVGHPFVIGEVSADALGRAVPDIGAFRRASLLYKATEPHALSLYVYVKEGDRLRTRMFSPLAGTIEDAATGSAATPLAALLLSLSDGSAGRFDVLQGVEMGRPSKLLCTASRTAHGIRASVSGSCVQMFKGEIALPASGETLRYVG